MVAIVVCRLDTSSAAERLLEELGSACGCERPDINVTARGSQHLITVHAATPSVASCAADVMRKLGAADVGERQPEHEATGPMDIVRQPGEDRLPTPDELPVGDRVTGGERVRPSRSGTREVSADRRRSRAPYSGTERRTR